MFSVNAAPIAELEHVKMTIPYPNFVDEIEGEVTPKGEQTLDLTSRNNTQLPNTHTPEKKFYIADLLGHNNNGKPVLPSGRSNRHTVTVGRLTDVSERFCLLRESIMACELTHKDNSIKTLVICETEEQKRKIENEYNGGFVKVLSRFVKQEGNEQRTRIAKDKMFVVNTIKPITKTQAQVFTKHACYQTLTGIDSVKEQIKQKEEESVRRYIRETNPTFRGFNKKELASYTYDLEDIETIVKNTREVLENVRCEKSKRCFN